MEMQLNQDPVNTNSIASAVIVSITEEPIFFESVPDLKAQQQDSYAMPVV